MMELLRQETMGEIKYLSYSARGIRSRLKYFYDHVNNKNGHFTAYKKTRKTIKTVVKKNKVEFHQIQGKRIKNSLTSDIDILICGSDQIWHPENYNDNYFLGFGSNRMKRVAYAASLPKTHTETQFTKQYSRMKTLLSKFDEIYVREPSSVPFVEKLSSQKVGFVMDPTFLVPVAFWNNMIENMTLNNGYAFVYIPNGMNNDMVDIIQKIKETLNINDVYVMITRGENLLSDARMLNFVSVGQFLYLIRNAKCVITSSFHAVVFSTIFHTDFYAYDVENKTRGEDIRLSDILMMLGLENKRIDLSRKIDQSAVDYAMVDSKIEEYKKKSIDILKKCME